MITKEQHIAETMEHAVSTVDDPRIQVSTGLLDQMMNLTGELVLTRNRILRCAKTEQLDIQVLRTIAQRLNATVSELQEMVMKTRMQPIKKVFGVLPRVVRDLAQIHGKEVELRLEGQDIELDRALLDGLKEPLTQVVSNAIEHGIETPEDRAQRGKPRTGVMRIRAYHEGGQVRLDLADDGAGIDLEQIKTQALSARWLTPQQAAIVGKRSLLNLLFHPECASGALHTVKQNIERIGGSVEIRTEWQKGTTISIRIPLTLSIIPVLIVMAGGQRFAIPQMNLEELIMLQRDAGKSAGIETISGTEVYRQRGELLPLLRLDQVFRLASQDTTARAETNIVVVSAGTARFGVIVDEVGSTEEIVVKALSGHVRQIACYDGATIMGDGRVALILNLNGLLSAAQIDIEDLKTADEEERAAETSISDEAQQEQRQSIVLFRAGQGEYYGVPLPFVVRLEEFPASQIEHSGGREVLQYRGEVLPLLRLEPYLHLEPAPDPALLALIVFSVEKQVGLVVHEILNTVQISTQIDTETFQQKGLLGSTIVEGHAVLILDIHGLIELAFPAWYKKLYASTLSDAERRSTRVLLVEDSTFFMNIEKSYFASAGYQVATAEHGKAALDYLERHPVDVVITDIEMPYCNGYELTQQIKAREAWKSLPVMALTVLTGEEERRKGQAAGIDEYQIKLDRDEVLKTLERLILRSRRK